MAKSNEAGSVQHKQPNWKGLYFYQKSEVLSHLTLAFCTRFRPAQEGCPEDRMVQAARSLQQDIADGLADGAGSADKRLKLLHDGQRCLPALQSDFDGYMKLHELAQWDRKHPRFNSMLHFCRSHNQLSDYQPYFEQWTAEEMCNIAVTLCRMVDKMITTYIESLEKQFVAGLPKDVPGLQSEVLRLQTEVNRLCSILQQHGIEH